MKQPIFRATVALIGGLLLTAPAHAHFLWAQTNDDANQLSLYFGEGGEGVSTGVPADVIAKARAWKPNGSPLVTTLQSGAYRTPIDAATPVYGASQSWGVLDKSKEGRGTFRLEYFAKAATDLGKAGWSAGLPVELFARREGNQVLVTFKRGAAPVAEAEITVVSPSDEKGFTVKTDASGQARFPLSDAGTYALRAVSVDDTAGEIEGKKYPQTRNWTTLTFHNGSALARPVAMKAEPEPMGNAKADPRAYALLKAAHDNRQVMPADFGGFEATLSYRDGDQTKTGKLIYRRQGKTDILVDGLPEDDAAWLQDKVMNLIGHRRGGDFARGDGKNALTLAEGDNNAFGQLIRLNDGLGSEYRVKDGKVDEVTRTLGGMKFTITVLDTMTTEAGKYLANHFLVSYRDEKTNELKKVEGYRDSYAQLDGVWLPTGRIVYEMADTVSPRVRGFRLRDIKVLPATKVAATP